jgi:hypothetical protein
MMERRRRLKSTKKTVRTVATRAKADIVVLALVTTTVEVTAAEVEMGPRERRGDGAGAVANLRSPPGAGADFAASIARRTAVVGGRRSTATRTTAGV